MTIMEGGTIFETARTVRPPTFERTLSSKIDFELGKSAWNASSRIWGTSKPLLDGAIEEGQTRASPNRHGSFSNYVLPKPTAPLRTPTELNNENIPQSKLPWSSATGSTAFSSRQRQQPPSPTKQAQNQLSEFMVGNPNGTHDQTSLFAGSDPDVDEIAVDVQHSQNHRRGPMAGSRVLPSQARATTFGSTQFDSQVLALNSSRFHSNGVFASVQGYENEQNRTVDDFVLVDQMPDVLPPDGHISFKPTRNAVIENRYRYDSRIHNDAQANDRLSNPTYFGQSQPLGGDYDETFASLEALTLYQKIPGSAPSGMPVDHLQLHKGSPRNQPQIGHIFDPYQATNARAYNTGSRLNPQALPHYGTMTHVGRGGMGAPTNDHRSGPATPYYSATGTPPTGPQSVRSTSGSGISSRTSYHDHTFADRKFNGTDQYGYESSMLAMAPLSPTINCGYPYDPRFLDQSIRMNPLAQPYMGPGHAGLHNYQLALRMPREVEQAHVIRSPVLEDFRLNSRSNRRFELKDIYGYFVEFSGDQHGSRFIQQKLETANSDDKEQMFKEIQPNMLQLTTDVFGNYVIQKMFEHGNQTQKKMLANQMKGHVQHLSLGSYGCRVVQKAFEHVLTDQQASLVQELDGPNLQILKVVKDQNGNHVVQKAIERIPGEHVQFIVDAHRGQMAKMSTHQYGCRVIQRMLEYCQPLVKRVILDELLEHIHPLITDSFGNYVVQHIIQNGEPRDRRQVIDLILAQLLTFSKHKFASNIVEKSIDCADEDQREQILGGLTGPDEHAITPVLGLMRDQYGNYVLQKVFNQLHGARQLALRTDMECNYPILRRTSYGKQVTAIEKVLFGNGGGTPPPLTSSASSGSSTLASTDPSSTAGGVATMAHHKDVK